MVWITDYCDGVEGRRPALGETQSDKPEGGSNRLAGFWYWLWPGRFFGWDGSWAFIENPSPVRLQTSHPSIHRPISLMIYWLIDPLIVLLTYLLIRLLALSLLFWLASATGHGSHTPPLLLGWKKLFPFTYAGWECILTFLVALPWDKISGLRHLVGINARLISYWINLYANEVFFLSWLWNLGHISPRLAPSHKADQVDV